MVLSRAAALLALLACPVLAQPAAIVRPIEEAVLPGASKSFVAMEAGQGGLLLHLPQGERPSRGHPLVVIVPGHHCKVENYVSATQLLLSRGFAVALFQWQENAELSAEKWDARLKAVLDGTLAEGARAGSPIAGALDAGKMGIMGHSLGGSVATLRAARDARLKALAVFGPGGQENGFLNEARTIAGATLAIDGSLDRITPPETHGGRIVERAASPYKAHVVIKNGSHPNAPADFEADYIRDSMRIVPERIPVWPFVKWGYDFPILRDVKPMPGVEQRAIAFPYLAAWMERFVAGRVTPEVLELTGGKSGQAQLAAEVLTRAKFSPALAEGLPVDLARRTAERVVAPAPRAVARSVERGAEGERLGGAVGELSRDRAAGRVRGR